MTPSSLHGALQWRPRHSMPEVVLAVGLADSLLATLREIVPADSRLLVSADFREAERLLPSLPTACTVFAVPASRDLAFVNGYGRLRKLFPHVESLLVFQQDESDAGTVLEVGVFGVSELVSIARRGSTEALRAGLSRCQSENVARRLWISAKLQLPDSLVPVIKAALRKAHQPISGVKLAEVAGMHERTLRRYCTSARLPSPQWIIGWARLLVVAHYLDEPGRSVERIAELLAYPTPAALRNQLRRYTTHTASELRKLGAVSCVGRKLECAVRDRGAAPPVAGTSDRPSLSLVV